MANTLKSVIAQNVWLSNTLGWNLNSLSDFQQWHLVRVRKRRRSRLSAWVPRSPKARMFSVFATSSHPSTTPSCMWLTSLASKYPSKLDWYSSLCWVVNSALRKRVLVDLFWFRFGSSWRWRCYLLGVSFTNCVPINLHSQGNNLPCDWWHEGEGWQRWVFSIRCYAGCPGCCPEVQGAWNHCSAH